MAVPGRCVLQIWLAALVLLLNSNYLHSLLLYNCVCCVWPCCCFYFICAVSRIFFYLLCIVYHYLPLYALFSLCVQALTRADRLALFFFQSLGGGLSWRVSVQLCCFCSWCSSSVFYRYTTAKPFYPLRIACLMLQIYPPGSAFIWSLGGTVQGCIIFKNSRT